MGFHYGYEKRKFDAEWTRLEQEYRAAGMDDRQIAAMKEYDWTWFCSQRTYQNRVQALPSEQCEDESEQSCLFRKSESLSCTWDTGDVDAQRFGWLSSLEDELLYRRLCKLPEDDLELLTIRNEVYIGNMVQGKSGTLSYKSRKLVNKSEDEWIRVEGTHEAIISRELWDTVASIGKKKVRKSAPSDGCKAASILPPTLPTDTARARRTDTSWSLTWNPPLLCGSTG